MLMRTSGPRSAHGGQVVEASAEHWVELLTSGDLLTVYVLDEGMNPIPNAELGGKATVLVGGRSQTVALAPGDGNSLTGKLAPAGIREGDGGAVAHRLRQARPGPLRSRAVTRQQAGVCP